MNNVLMIAERFNTGKVKWVTEISTGLINQTFLIETEELQSPDKFILQKLNKQIGKEVIIDINAITKHLSKKGFTTPLLVKTLKGELFIKSNGDIWRVLTFIEGNTFDELEDKKLAQNAGCIIGRFHSALLDCNHTFIHKINNFHDTDQIIRHMKSVLSNNNENQKNRELRNMSEYIFTVYENIRGSIKHLPDRIIHGDLKLSNIIFSPDTNDAISLIDLDTIGRHKIVIDLGDALRSMCNNGNRFDLETFTYFIDGYLSEAHFLTKEETRSISAGIETIMLELAARYITDAIEQSYFRLDESKFPDLYSQNKTKAEINIELHKDFLSKKLLIQNILDKY